MGKQATRSERAAREADRPGRVAPLRCHECGSGELFAIAPGSDHLMDAGLLVLRGAPDKAWCRRCWAKAYGGG